jgi:hypothetical protein
MTLRKREDTEDWKREHYFVMCEELTLKEAVELV